MQFNAMIEIESKFCANESLYGRNANKFLQTKAIKIIVRNADNP